MEGQEALVTRTFIGGLELGLVVWTIWAKMGLEIVWPRWERLEEAPPVQSHSLLGLAGQDVVSPGSWDQRDS